MTCLALDVVALSYVFGFGSLAGLVLGLLAGYYVGKRRA